MNHWQFSHESIEKKKYSAIWQYPNFSFKWLVFDKIGLYATSPGRVLLSVCVFLDDIWAFFIFYSHKRAW